MGYIRETESLPVAGDCASQCPDTDLGISPWLSASARHQRSSVSQAKVKNLFCASLHPRLRSFALFGCLLHTSYSLPSFPAFRARLAFHALFKRMAPPA